MAEMVSLIDDIVETLTPLFATAKVADYDTISKLVTPLVAIKEMPTSTGRMLIDADGHDMPYILRNEYTVEIYSKATKVGSTYLPASKAAMALFKGVDSALNEKFSLTMTGSPNQAPYPADTTVSRIVARYYCYIDTRNNTILRRI